MPKKQTKKSKPKYIIYKYAVVRFNDLEEVGKLFECIPDRWFLDETKTRCYWPPNTGTPYKIRAIRCEEPDDSWNVYEVKVVSDGHLTYNSGFKIVLEKCNQKYNTSSAEEQIDAANFRRKHPVLAMQNEGNGSIEHVFSKPNNTKRETGKLHKARLSSKKSDSADSAKISNSNVDGSSSTAASIDNLDFENNERGESEMDYLSLDCGNKNKSRMSLDGQNQGTIAPKNASKDGYNSTMDSAAVSPSPSSTHRSTHVPSIASRSSVSESSGSRSIYSRSKNSRSSCSSSNRSNSSRSRSNSLQSRCESIKSPKRQSRFQSRSPSGRQPLNRSRSPVSISSASRRANDDNRRPLPWQPMIKQGGNSITGFNVASTSNTNDRTKLIKSNGNVSKSNEKRKGSVRSSSYHSSRSPSIQISSSSSNRFRSNRHRSRSRSRIILTNTVRQKQNQKEQRQPIHADIRQNRGQKTTKSSINGKHDNRRSLEDSGNIKSKSKNHLKSRIGNHRSRSNNRRSSSDYSRSRSRRSFSSRGSSHQSSKHEVVNFHRQKNIKTSSKCDSTADLMNAVQKLTDTISKNNQQLKENDRRLHRMELTVNKIFVLVGDMNGNAVPILDELANDHGFEIPKLPIESTNELAVMKRKLKDKEFRDFFLQFEKDFCCPTKKSTDTVTISKYLMRFISLRVRSKLTLKESGDGATLFKDYHHVYQFLIDVMKTGYKYCRKTITNDDAHSALRVVWGRSKQYYRDEQERMQR